MYKFFHTILNIVYLTWLTFVSILFELALPFFLLIFFLLRQGKLDDAFRIHNWAYGNYLVKLSWPYIRYSIKGRENIPADTSFVIVINHRSSFDIFFSSLVPIANQLVIVRDWVYRIKLVRWAMKLAKYMNIDHTSLEYFRRTGKEFKGRNVSFQFYPEGHRSRSGKLLRFRTGAFFMASENDLPVLPVIMTGAEKFGSYEFPWLHPAKIVVNILPPVYPENFDKNLRAQKMRRSVEKIYRDFLGE
jgi:1-acyl-sn-glycerol-3-phosphate acyltransferase